MEVIILAHEKDIGACEEEDGNDQVCPMCRYGIGAKIDESQRDGQLQGHIEQAHRQVAHPQLICHQLVCMLAVGLAEVLVEHKPMDDGQCPIYPVYQQEDQPRHVASLHDLASYHEQQDKRDSYATHVSGKTPGHVLGSEIKEAEYQHRKDRHHYQALAHKLPAVIPGLTRNLIQQQQRNQDSQRVGSRDTVDTVHEIVDVRSTHADNQSNDNRPPEAGLDHVQLPEHHAHRHKLRHEPHAVGQRVHIIPEAHSGGQRHCGQQPGVLEPKERAPHPQANGEDHTPTPQHHLRVAASPVGLVDDVATVSNPEVQQLRRQQQHCDDNVCPNHILYLFFFSFCR